MLSKAKEHLQDTTAETAVVGSGGFKSSFFGSSVLYSVLLVERPH